MTEKNFIAEPSINSITSQYIIILFIFLLIWLSSLLKAYGGDNHGYITDRTDILWNANKTVSWWYDNSHLVDLYTAYAEEMNCIISIPDKFETKIHVECTIKNIDADRIELARCLNVDESFIPIDSLKFKDENQNVYAVTKNHINPGAQNEQEYYEINDINHQQNITYSYIATLPSKDSWSHRFVPGEYAVLQSHNLLLQPKNIKVDNILFYYDLPDGWEAVTRLIATDVGYEVNTSDPVYYIYHNNENERIIDIYYLWGPMAFGPSDIYRQNIGGIEVVLGINKGTDVSSQGLADAFFDIFKFYTNNLFPLGAKGLSQKFVGYYMDAPQDDTYLGSNHMMGDYRVVNQDNFTGKIPEIGWVVIEQWFWKPGYGVSLSWNTLFDPSWIKEGLFTYLALIAAHKTGWIDDAHVHKELIRNYNEYGEIKGTEYDIPISEMHELWDLGFIEEANILWYHKGAIVAYLLDNQIALATDGEKSIIDMLRYLYFNVQNYPFEPLSDRELLYACNIITGRDFSEFFRMFITGDSILPVFKQNGQILIDKSALPSTPPMTTIDLVKLPLVFNQKGVDSDGDGLSDEHEDYIGTNPYHIDTDGDGLSDRHEYGVIVDGLFGEYCPEEHYILDATGDNQSLEPGTDIKSFYTTIFQDQESFRWLYLTLQVTDAQYNPNAWYEFHFSTDNGQYQYRLDNWGSYLLMEQNNEFVRIDDNQLKAYFAEQLEVLIPMGIIGHPESLNIQARIRIGEQPHLSHGLKEVDSTAVEKVNLYNIPHIYVTDPLNPDTDNDGFSDKLEIDSGTDPTDPNCFPDGDSNDKPDPEKPDQNDEHDENIVNNGNSSSGCFIETLENTK